MAIRIFVPTYTTRSHSYSYNAFLQHVHVICTYGRIYCCHEVCSAVYRICGISGKNTASPYILPYQHTTKHRIYNIRCYLGRIYRISSVCLGVPQLLILRRSLADELLRGMGGRETDVHTHKTFWQRQEMIPEVIQGILSPQERMVQNVLTYCRRLVPRPFRLELSVVTKAYHPKHKVDLSKSEDLK